MQQKVGKSGWFGWLVTASFAVGGLMTLRDFVAALLGGPDTTTRRIAQTDDFDIIIAVILIGGTAGLVWLAYRFPTLRAQVGPRFVAAWALMLTGGVLYNLLPALIDVSIHTRTLITAPLYSIGALVFVWWLVWPRREHQGFAAEEIDS